MSPCRPWSGKRPLGASQAGYCSPVFRDANEAESYDVGPASVCLGTFSARMRECFRMRVRVAGFKLSFRVARPVALLLLPQM